MKKINELKKILETSKNTDLFNKIEKNYQLNSHPAKNLDEFMKEQYIVSLYSILALADESSAEAENYILYIAEKINYKLIANRICEIIYELNNEKRNDIITSFRDENIKYLLAFEIELLFVLLNENSKIQSYKDDFINSLEISIQDMIFLKSAVLTVKSNDLNIFKLKTYNSHIHDIQCYIEKFDFKNQRTVVYSNCLEEVRTSECDRSYDQYAYEKFAHFAEGSLQSNYSVGKYTYVEKGTSLGYFVVRIFGCSLRKFGSKDDWNEIENNENSYLRSPKYKNYELFLFDYYEENTYDMVDIIAEKSGILFMFFNCIDKYNLPFAIISHPLDNSVNVEKFLAEKLKERFSD